MPLTIGRCDVGKHKVPVILLTTKRGTTQQVCTFCRVRPPRGKQKNLPAPGLKTFSPTKQWWAEHPDGDGEVIGPLTAKEDDVLLKALVLATPTVTLGSDEVLLPDITGAAGRLGGALEFYRHKLEAQEAVVHAACRFVGGIGSKNIEEEIQELTRAVRAILYPEGESAEE